MKPVEISNFHLSKTTPTTPSSQFNWKIQRGLLIVRDRRMASTSAVSMAMPLTKASQKRVVPSSYALFKPLPAVRPSRVMAGASKSSGRLQVKASLKEKAVTGLTAAALTASMIIPDVAEAAGGSGLSPSLNNFLLSIAAGGVVLFAIVGAVVGVANFDPVKRS